MNETGFKRPKRLPKAHVDFLRGYYCCLANILMAHGDNTHIKDALHGAGTTEEILRYADQGDVEALQNHGYLKPDAEEPTDPAQGVPTSQGAA